MRKNHSTLPIVRLVWALMLLFPCSSTYAKDNGFKLDKNSPSQTRIVIPENPSATERDAAEMLKAYLEKVFHYSFRIIPEKDNSLGNNEGIFIGNTTLARLTLPHFADNLGLDGYRIVSTRKNLLLLGGSRHGITYAVTAFLEDYVGCRRFTEEEEYIPQRTSLILPVLDTTSLPAVDVRIINAAPTTGTLPGQCTQPVARRAWRNGRRRRLKLA